QVVAPRAGVVGDVPVRVGDRVLTTTTLTTVDRPGSLEAYIYVPIEKSAQFSRARVIWASEERPAIPVVAVSRIGGLYFAFVAEPDQKGGFIVHQKPIQIGQIVGNNYVVLDGVKPGDKVVVSGTQFLVDGVPVVPQESSS